MEIVEHNLRSVNLKRTDRTLKRASPSRIIVVPSISSITGMDFFNKLFPSNQWPYALLLGFRILPETDRAPIAIPYLLIRCFVGSLLSWLVVLLQ